MKKTQEEFSFFIIYDCSNAALVSNWSSLGSEVLWRRRKRPPAPGREKWGTIWVKEGLELRRKTW